MIDEALFFQSTFAISESGHLEEATYAAYLAWFASIIDTPGGAIWWKTTGRQLFNPAMVAAVDRRVAAGGLNDLGALPAMQLDE